MSLRNAKPVRFAPHSLSDALDATDAFPGAMASLQNLIPDPTTADVWTCRPAHVLRTAFPALANPDAISVFKVVGSLVYGLIASTRTPGFDQPFCYDLSTGLGVVVTGITGANVPTTQPTTGDWTPPTMDLCGVNLVVTHPGFNGGGNGFFGWFDTSTPGAPVWHSGNTTGAIVLTTAPSWVAQFNGRAYFGINPPTGQPSAVFTDSLTLVVTNASQALTFGNNLPLTAAKGLPLSNQLGGVIQSLLVFKGATNIEQITGDPTTTDLAVNTLNVATGTLAARTLATSPLGVMFMSPDGVRYVDFDARVSEPIGVAGSGVNLPFQSPSAPSRACAACTAEVLRISVYNVHAPGTPLQDFWYDFVRKVWSGPHTFPASMLGVYNNAFVVAAPNILGLFTGDLVPGPTSTTVELGVALTWVWQTAMLPDNNEMAMSEIAEMQVKTSAVSGTPAMTVTAQDENGVAYNAMTYAFPVGSQSVWGSFNWGGLWGGQFLGLAPRRIGFSAPVVYNRLAVSISGTSTIGFRIGDMLIRQRQLGYMQVGL